MTFESLLLLAAEAERMGSYLSEDSAPLVYLLAAVLFVLGLKGLTHPRTAVRGNLLGAGGMAVAVGAALLLGHYPPEEIVVIQGIYQFGGVGLA